ncbi:hypothetical protein [Zavarzinella formosa]|uniref:hypothetical protein n=1 Tax=Zavarzinella formosa TaxID=360055 RepID=UPI0002FFA7F8|nr:hypothetical protein [Zavarzinella formosa]
MNEAASQEADDRFPSGKWVGFFLDSRIPGKHQMELSLTFVNGKMTGEGRDRVGEFVVTGGYDTRNGECLFSKQYLNAHRIAYRGFNEGKGIWGTWELRWGFMTFKGGFHIWPEGMGDPTNHTLKEEIDLPLMPDVNEDARERELAPALDERH